MSDSQFAVTIFIALILLSFLAGGAGVWVALSGVHECSVEVEYAGSHKVEYMTECRL